MIIEVGTETNKKDFYESTSINVHYEIVMIELQNEKDKKDSFDNRAAIIIGILGVMISFLADKLNLLETLHKIGDPVQFFPVLKILIVVLLLVSFGFSIVYSVKVININEYLGYKIKEINQESMKENENFYKAKIVITYKDIVVSYRKNNSKKAIYIKESINWMISFFICSIILIVF